ncbi:hypothetical protein [Cryptosporangium sp. NPDC048952]|uniref:hypothetical protein n=1 Tax=Cryptosporangium sp. NPDC048952 TaxID=3363961 RepID=UPI0037230A53
MIVLPFGGLLPALWIVGGFSLASAPAPRQVLALVTVIYMLAVEISVEVKRS